MAKANPTRTRVRFTAEVDYELRSRGEVDRIEYAPGTWTGFTGIDVRDALETVLRRPELSLAARHNAGLDQRSKWTPSDIIDESCREDAKGRIERQGDTGLCNAQLTRSGADCSSTGRRFAHRLRTGSGWEHVIGEDPEECLGLWVDGRDASAQDS